MYGIVLLFIIIIILRLTTLMNLQSCYTELHMQFLLNYDDCTYVCVFQCDSAARCLYLGHCLQEKM